MTRPPLDVVGTVLVLLGFFIAVAGVGNTVTLLFVAGCSVMILGTVAVAICTSVCCRQTP